MTININGRPFDYLTLRHGRYGGIDVVGWGEYPDHSVLAGQAMKVFLTNEPDEPAARTWILREGGKKALAAVTGFSSVWTDPPLVLSHLPDENTQAPGGAWPDDID